MSVAGVASVALLSTQTAQADWEQVYSLPTTYAHFITSEGLHLMSDYRDNRDGGIYYSDDSGATWTKTAVRDYWFSNFYEADGYLFAIGAGCRIARSEDGGRTWDLLNYSKTVEEWIPKGATEESVCYGITVLDGVLYAADFSGGGIISSPDYGETWEMTDRESLYIYLQGDTQPYMDNFYHLEAYKGKVYAFGMYSIHSYSPDEKIWKVIPINSNFMGSVTIFNDKLICARAVANDDINADYMFCCDGETWSVLDRPDTKDNNVRFLWSDDRYIYSMHHEGPMYYTDDMGATWNVSSNFPGGLYPLTIATDNDYVYAGVYSPIPSETQSGLWRMSKSELKSSGIDLTVAEGHTTPAITDDRLICGGQALSVNVFSTDGQLIVSANNVAEIDLSELHKGIYIYNVNYSSHSISGKFVRQ